MMAADVVDWNLFQQALGERNWPIVAACAIMLVVRIAKFPALGNYWDKVPKQYRPLIPVVLGTLSGVGEALIMHRPWLMTVLFGVFSGLLAIGADQALTKPLTKAASAAPSTEDKQAENKGENT